MIPELARDRRVFDVLHRIDTDLQQSTRLAGCPHCKGPLHEAHYTRKPRGAPDGVVPEEYCERLGLCCGRCRKRTLPPSALFLGRKVYWGQVVLVVMALRQRRPDGYSARKLRALFGVSWRTVLRWIGYFREEFPASEQWRRLRGRVSPVVLDGELPTGLLDHFSAWCRSMQEGLAACLRFMASGCYGAASP